MQILRAIWEQCSADLNGDDTHACVRRTLPLVRAGGDGGASRAFALPLLDVMIFSSRNVLV